MPPRASRCPSIFRDPTGVAPPTHASPMALAPFGPEEHDEEARGPDPTFDEVMAAARLVDAAARDEPSPARAAAAREFLGRAERAVARGAPDPAGEPPLRLESRAWLAMTLGRDEEAVRAWD